MKTMIESTPPEVANTNADKVEPKKPSNAREHILTWLIAVASLVVAIQVFRTVALQLEVNHALDELYEVAGQASPSKS